MGQHTWQQAILDKIQLITVDKNYYFLIQQYNDKRKKDSRIIITSLPVSRDKNN